VAHQKVAEWQAAAEREAAAARQEAARKAASQLEAALEAEARAQAAHAQVCHSFYRSLQCHCHCCARVSGVTVQESAVEYSSATQAPTKKNADTGRSKGECVGTTT